MHYFDHVCYLERSYGVTYVYLFISAQLFVFSGVDNCLGFCLLVLSLFHPKLPASCLHLFLICLDTHLLEKNSLGAFWSAFIWNGCPLCLLHTYHPKISFYQQDFVHYSAVLGIFFSTFPVFVYSVCLFSGPHPPVPSWEKVCWRKIIWDLSYLKMAVFLTSHLTDKFSG